MSPSEVLLLVNAAATWFMCGVVWFVQLVHYPLFGSYDREDYPAVMGAHQRRTGRVVFAVMLTELVTAVLLVPLGPGSVPGWMTGLGAALAGVWAASTAAVQIPLHQRLSAGYDPAAHRWLVASNWVRTAAWSARGGLCMVMLGLARG